jgi:hypothetical protein
MSLFNQISSAALQAQGTLAQMMGAAANTKNLQGPDGRSYYAVPRAASSFEIAEAEATGLTLHGQQARELMVISCTRGQFTSAPLNWRLKQLTLLAPAPARICTIHSVSTSDPLHYVFTVHYRQPAAP